MKGQSRAERRRSRREEERRTGRPEWSALEEYARAKIQEWIQELIEEEVTELLGRRKSERRATVDPADGYRNGYGKPRRLSMSMGTATARRLWPAGSPNIYFGNAVVVHCPESRARRLWAACPLRGWAPTPIR